MISVIIIEMGNINSQEIRRARLCPGSLKKLTFDLQNPFLRRDDTFAIIFFKKL